MVTNDSCPVTSCLPVFPEPLFLLLLVPGSIMLPAPLQYPLSLVMLLILAQDSVPLHPLYNRSASVHLLPMKTWVWLWRQLETCGIVCVTGICSRLCSRWAAAQIRTFEVWERELVCSSCARHWDLLSSAPSWHQYRHGLEYYWRLCSLVVYIFGWPSR